MGSDMTEQLTHIQTYQKGRYLSIKFCTGCDIPFYSVQLKGKKTENKGEVDMPINIK